MQLVAQIDYVLTNRHDEVREAMAAVEIVLRDLELAGGVVAPEVEGEIYQVSRWGKSEPQRVTTRTRYFDTSRLRDIWGRFAAEVAAHLKREELVLPRLASGLLTGEVPVSEVSREVTAFMAEHEYLYRRTAEVRKAFLSLEDGRRAVARFQDAFEVHAETEDTGIFQDLVQFAELSVDLDATPVMRRYQDDPEGMARSLRQEAASAPPPEPSGLVGWFKKAFKR